MDIPFQLNQGIYFEDLDILIPWGTPIDELHWYDSPKIYNDASLIDFYWYQRCCLGGLQCSVHTFFPVPEEGGKDKLYRVEISTFEYHESLGHDTWQQFQSDNAHLIHFLGKPDENDDNWDQLDHPFMSWHKNQIIVSHFITDYHGAISKISIRHQKFQIR